MNSINRSTNHSPLPLERGQGVSPRKGDSAGKARRRLLKSQLGRLYFPHLTAASARQALMYEIAVRPDLQSRLREAGMSRTARGLSPGQVAIICQTLGPPSDFIPSRSL